MIRIRGTVGDLPVDLTVELDEADWARLGTNLSLEPTTVGVATTATSRGQNDAMWQTTLSLVQRMGQIDGPSLLAQLEGLAGSAAAAKRLLVRLRHCREVTVQSGADTPLYCWKQPGAEVSC